MIVVTTITIYADHRHNDHKRTQARRLVRAVDVTLLPF
jgi:hypothetical protein